MFPQQQPEQTYNPVEIWYAPNSRARSSLKLLVYEDKGYLSLRDGTLSFHGMRHAFQISKVEDVQLGLQTPNWPWHAAGATLLFFLLIGQGSSIFVVVPLIALMEILAFSIGFATKWVKVTYQSADGSTSTAWFADGGHFGWDGLLGGTSRLWHTLRAATLAIDPKARFPLVLGAVPSAPKKPVAQECPWCEQSVIPDENSRCPACDRPI